MERREQGNGSVCNASDGGDGSGSNVSDGEQWGAANEALLARLPLSSCSAARFLTGLRPALVRGLGGLGIPGVKNTHFTHVFIQLRSHVYLDSHRGRINLCTHLS